MIKIGVIGCGYWGPNLVRNFHEGKNSQVVSVCDLREERLNLIKQKYPYLKITKDYEDILKDKTINAIAIATPVSTHFQLAKEALLAEKHILVEKPLAASSEEAKELIEIARRKKKILMVDHTFVYTSAVRKMKEIVKKGELGKIYYFDSVRINLGLFRSDVNVLWDLAPHDFSIMDFLLEETPISVQASGSSHINTGFENIVYVTIHFKNSLIGHIHVNWMAPVKIRTTLISGSKKMIVYNDLEPIEKVKVYNRGVTLDRSRDTTTLNKYQYRVGDIYIPHFEDVEALQTECNHFVECILKNKKPTTDGEAGLRVVRLLEASQYSLKNGGKEVKLNNL